MVPYKVGDATSNGAGLMGQYSPIVQYLTASQLPTVAVPVKGPTTCGSYPAGPPALISPSNQLCQIELPSPMAITQVSTQCTTPGCNQVFLEPQPPISIVGSGFGSFPFGLPYTGNSSFIQITDTTQNWSAGYTGDPCTVQIGEWSDTLISLVANVNQNGVCPLATGDMLAFTVWNPQHTVSSISTTRTVNGQSQGKRPR